MFIAMNRFQVKIGSEAAFETVWRTRESYLSNMAGFVEFRLRETERVQLNGLENRRNVVQVWPTIWLSGVVVELPMKLSSPV